MKLGKNEIKIGISKTKAILLTLLIIVLFAITVWAILKVITMNPGFNKTYLLILLSILMITFGLLTISAFKKLTDNSQGLLINDSGIEINIGPNRGQFIEWSNVEKIKIHDHVRGNIYILLFLKNPSEIILKAKGLNRILLKLNNKSHKTPVSITSTWLKMSLFEIMEIIEEKMNKTVHNSA